MKRKSLLVLTTLLAVGCGSTSNDTCSADEKAAFEIEKFKVSANVEAYGIVHQQYAGVMKAKTDADGKISSLYLDEVFLPHHWAEIGNTGNSYEQSIVADTHVPTTTISYAATSTATTVTTKKFADKIVINDVQYTLNWTAIAAAASKKTISEVEYPIVTTLYEVPLYKSGEVGLSLSGAYSDNAWLKGLYDSTAALTKTETAEPKTGIVAVDGLDDSTTGFKESGTKNILIKNDVAFFAYKAANATGATLRKYKGTYWVATGADTNNAIGWQGNVNALLNHIVAYGFVGLDQATQVDGIQVIPGTGVPTADKFWHVPVSDDLVVNTGCTWSDGAQYYALALKVYALLKA